MGIEGVCNSFQARTLNDQICYEVDLDRFSNENNIEMQLKLGLIFIMDYNEDRQVTFHQNYFRKKKDSFPLSIVESEQDEYALIYLDTIGEHFLFIYIRRHVGMHALHINLIYDFRASYVKWTRRIQYRCNNRYQSN